MSTNNTNDTKPHVKAITHLNLDITDRSKLYDIHIMSKTKVESLAKNKPEEFKEYVKVIIELLQPTRLALKLILHHDYAWLVQQVGNVQFLNNIKSNNKKMYDQLSKDDTMSSIELLQRVALHLMFTRGTSLMSALFDAQSMIDNIPITRREILNKLEIMEFKDTDIFNESQINVFNLITYLSLILNVNPNTIASKLHSISNKKSKYKSREFNIIFGIPTLPIISRYRYDWKKFNDNIIDELLEYVEGSIRLTGHLKGIEKKLKALYIKYNTNGRYMDIYDTRKWTEDDGVPISNETNADTVEVYSTEQPDENSKSEFVKLRKIIDEANNSEDNDIEIDEIELTLKSAFEDDETEFVVQDIKDGDKMKLDDRVHKEDAVIGQDEQKEIIEIIIPQTKEKVSSSDRFIDFVTKLKDLIDEYPELDKLQYSFIINHGLKMDGNFEKSDQSKDEKRICGFTDTNKNKEVHQ